MFLSPSFNQSSRDFCFQRISLLRSHSDSSTYNSSSILPFSSAEGLFWTSKILSISRLILTWQCSNTSLFHLWSASLIFGLLFVKRRESWSSSFIVPCFFHIGVTPIIFDPGSFKPKRFVGKTIFWMSYSK